MPTRLTIRQLQMILALEQAGSVSAAAQRLQVSQSALSHRIREAERLLGTDLYLRQNKKLIPTVTGQRVAHAAKVILTELERTELDVAQLHAGVQQNLRLGLHVYASGLWLPSLMASMHDKAPAVGVQVVADTGMQPLTSLRKHDVDVALVSGYVEGRDLWFEHLFDDELVAVVSEGHEWCALERVEASLFAEQTYVAHHTNPESGREYEVVFSANDVLPKKVLRAGLTEAVLALVSAGQGVTLLPAWTARLYSHTMPLQLIPLAGPTKALPWYLAMHKEAQDNDAMGVFVEVMREVCESSL